jgi:ribosomal protein L33
MEFYDVDVLQLRIKLSPYIGEFTCYEVSTGILYNSPYYSWIFKKYNVLFDLIKQKIPITNLNPGTVYMYALDSTIYGTYISQISSQYTTDKTNLQKYCDDMNNHIPDLNLTFSGDRFKWNRKYKLKKVSDETQDIIKFPKISSFIYEDNYLRRI